MFATTREENRHGKVLDLLESERGGIRIETARIGAELVSLERQRPDGSWVRFLWRDGDLSGDGPGWKNHCTVMGYYVHRLLDQRSEYAGEPVEGGTHGFLRHADFPPPEFSSEAGSHLVYHLPYKEIPRGAYPRKVDFTLTYLLTTEGWLEVEFAFRNREHDRPAHVSFGLHPGFAVGSLSSFILLAPPGEYIRHLAPGNFLSGETQVVHHEGGPFHIHRAELPDSFIYEITGVQGREFTLIDPASGRQVTMDYSEAPYLTLWSDGSKFVCVEPCWGLPDHREQRPFEEKAGLEVIEPGGTLKRKIRIHPNLVPED